MSRDWIAEKSASTLHPRQVENTLRRMEAGWAADGPALSDAVRLFPLGESALLHLLAISSICAGRLAHEPALLLWLAEPLVGNSPRNSLAMLAELRHVAAGEPVAAGQFHALRRWKSREMLRIALREISGAAPLEETTAELSQIAELCMAEVFRHWNTELRARRGAPEAELAILGLGKLGGRELNHSSDIDVIFLYSDEGQLSANFTYHQWFNLLAAKIVETFSTVSANGPLFRIDVRLRPEGAAGPLTRSLESMENYYAGFGETWERLALIKARSIAGSPELAYEFLRQHQPFIYPHSPTPDLLDEIATIKARIERDVVGHENIGRNVKLGSGGIREIEFVVQALQLLHGARHAFLHESSTLKALLALAELELLPRDETRTLGSAYRFLRQVEHRLQIEAEQQTHTLPENPEALERLARSLAFPSGDLFLAALRETMEGVRKIFDRVISAPATETTGTPETEIFRDEKAAGKSLTDLAQGPSSFHVAPRTRQVFRRLRPLLLEQLARSADPDRSLNQLVRFVEAYGLRSLLFELLVANPRLLELLVKIFDASRYAGDLLVRRPQLLEEITRREMLDRSVSVAAHLRNLAALHAEAPVLDTVRVYRHAQNLRIMLRDVLELANLDAVIAENSALAEACLVFVNRLQTSNETLTLIALGKFGGNELSYGADLDLLFIGEDTAAAQQLMVSLVQPTSEGSICALDPRLRPDGEKGSLTTPLAAYENYFEKRAQLWEVQALTRARPLPGPEADAFLEMAQRIWRQTGQQPDLIPQISTMLDRIRRDRAGASDELDFKAGTGGMIVAEFLVQALQMRAGVWATNTGEALDALVASGDLPADDAAQFRESYGFLRRIESALRRFENRSISSVPVTELQQRQLAHRVGARDLDDFATQYRSARIAIDALRQRHLR